MASLVVNVGLQPSEVKGLTRFEQAAIVAEFNRVERAKK